MRPYLTLHHPGAAREYYRLGFWRDQSLYALAAQHAAERGDQIALRDASHQLSWQELIARTDALAADFIANGLSGGDRVSVWMSNRIDPVIAALACSRNGMACNPSLHRTHTCEEIGVLLNRLQSVALITEPEWGADHTEQNFAALLDSVPSLKKCYMAGELPLSTTDALPAAHCDPDTVSYLAFTSGTTGPPKCVMHSANTLLANARDMVNDWQLTPDARILSLSPLSHHIAWVAVAEWLAAGCQLITDDKPAQMTHLDWIEHTGASYVMGVPTHAMDILAQRDARGQQEIGQVKTFYMAGAPIPPVVAEAFVNAGIRPQNVYGMTENSSHQYTHPDDPLATWINTCGRGGPAYEVAVFDPENPDNPLPVGQTGHIGGRGAALMLGYYDNQAATADSFNRDGWFLSGDLGSLDDDGNLSIEGRLKDLIIRGGHNIYPSRIEALALRHPDIAKAAAFAVPDDRLGEKVCLAIIGNVNANDTLTHLAENGLSRYDMPEYFVATTELPLTPSGKILKRALAQMVQENALQPKAVRYQAANKGV